MSFGDGSRNIEDAFDRYCGDSYGTYSIRQEYNFLSGDDRVVSYDLFSLLGFDDMAEDLVGFERRNGYLSNIENDRFRQMERNRRALAVAMTHLPVDAEIIRMRQLLTGQLIDIENGSTPIKLVDNLEALNTLVATIEDLINGRLKGFYMTGEDVYEDEDYYRRCVSSKSTSAFKKLAEFLSGVSDRGGYMAQLKAMADEAVGSWGDFVSRLAASSFLPIFSAIKKYESISIPTDEHYDALRVTMETEKPGIIDGERNAFRSFQFYCEKISAKSESLQRFAAALKNFRTAIYLAEVAHASELSPVEIVEGEDVIEFKGMRHPKIVSADFSSRTSVNIATPVDVMIPSDKSILVVTGDHGNGKSKLAEAVVFNGALTQAIGYALVGPGSRYTPRSQLAFTRSIPYDPNDIEMSRGEREMAYFIPYLNNLRPGGLLVADEALTSTDMHGAVGIVMALLERYGEASGISIVTIHSRLVEALYEKGILPRATFIKTGDRKYSFEEGVGRADSIELARENGMPEEAILRAKKIMEGLE